MTGTVYVNGRFLVQPQTGVNRYAYELCRALNTLGVVFTIICPPKEINSCYDIASFRILHWGVGNSHFWEQLVLPLFFLNKRKKDILLNFTGIGPVLHCRKVITIHDLAFLINSGWYKKSYRLLYRCLTPLSAATSLKILTVSHFSKNEIIRLLHLKSAKIEVVYNAVPACFHAAQRVSQVDDSEQRRYVLAVSSIDPRKNFERLLKAFQLLKDSQIDLYVVGGQSRVFASLYQYENKESFEQINVKWFGRVSDDELTALYRKARCFIYPSLYEGFGIPPLEAMAMGCPVIVSDIPVLHEVCGDAALYTDPADEEDIALKIKELCSNDVFRDLLINRGFKQIGLYDWQVSAKKILTVIHHL